MPAKVFKLSTPRDLSADQIITLLGHWRRVVKGSDLEGSRLLILPSGATVEPLSETAVLQEAADVLERRGNRAYAAQLRKLAGG